MPYDVESETRSNSKDIQALTNTVTRVVTMQENTEKRNEEMLQTIKQSTANTEQLNKRMSELTLIMQGDIKALSESMSSIREDNRVNRHDIGDIKNGLGSIDVVSNKVAGNSERITKIESIMEAKIKQVDLIEVRQTENTKVVTAAQVDIDSLKAWRNKHSGATGMAKYVISGVWVLLGGAIVVIAQHYFK